MLMGYYRSAVILGKAQATLWAVRPVASIKCSLLIIESDSWVTVLAINNPYLFCDWNTESVLAHVGY
jgi:hypothetical protein